MPPILHLPQNDSETLTTATITPVTLPQNARELFFQMADAAVAWEIDLTDATMAAPIQVAAGGAFVIDRSIVGSTFYFRQSSGGDVDLRYAFLLPVTI